MRQYKLMILLALLAFCPFLLVQAQAPPGHKQCLRFSGSTAIQSNDGGRSWHLSEGTRQDVPEWAQSWLRAESAPEILAWHPSGNVLQLQNGTILRHDAASNTWVLDAGQAPELPTWARRWLADAPRQMPGDLPETGVESLCGSESTTQRTQNLRFGPNLAIRSYDGGQTWVMVQGSKAELPSWAARWLERPAPAVQPAKERAFGDALIRSVDGGQTWTLVKGKMENLPAWVRPWLGEGYPDAPTQRAASGENATVHRAISLFPNPTQHAATLRFQLDRKQEVRVELYDLQGRILRQLATQELPMGVHDLDFEFADLPAGPYFLRFSSEAQQARIQFSKVK